jgi:hypothetical protein
MTSVPPTTTALDIWSQSTQEARRLARLGQLLSPSTKKLFEQAVITTGMKVLDVGSGARTSRCCRQSDQATARFHIR